MKMENGSVFRPIPPSVRPDTFSNPQPALHPTSMESAPSKKTHQATYQATTIRISKQHPNSVFRVRETPRELQTV